MSNEIRGPEIVRVPLTTSEVASLEKSDYLALMGLGIDPECCFLRYSTVVFYHPVWGPRTLVQLARVIVGCGAGEMVRYHDRNPLNLRRDNIRVAGSDTQTRPLEEYLKELPVRIAEGLVTSEQALALEYFLHRLPGPSRYAV